MTGKKQNNFLLLFNLTKSLVTLPGVVCIFLVLFFIMGNFQGFQDYTQHIILNVLGVCSIMFGLISFMGLVEIIIMFFIKDSIPLKSKIIFLILMIFCLLISFSFLSMSLILGVLTEGL
ncbi:MAG: hypothetical protein MJ181_08955 [Treponema sp.]|nr:hypothetical protein [Treponema sp.]